MKLNSRARLVRATGMFALGLGLALVAGCGGESTQPRAEVKVMGGILIARGMPAGAPYQAGAVVSVNGQVVDDAEVRLNGGPMVYMANPGLPEQTGYVGQVTAAPGDLLTLTATAAGQTVTLQATVPGMVEIQPPAGGLVYADNQDITIAWTPASGAVMTIVTCGGAGSTTPGMWLLAAGTNQRVIPAASTTVPGNRITVIGMSGSGDLPTSMDLREWAGKSGFWVTSQDYIDVMITG